jgi:hypothetical protein
MHEVHGPALVWCGGHDALLTDNRGAPALGCFGANAKVFFTVNAPNALEVYDPSFAPQEYRYPFVAVAHSLPGDLFDPGAQHRIIAFHWLIPEHLAIDIEHRADPAFAQTPELADLWQDRRATHVPHHFFLTTSCKT